MAGSVLVVAMNLGPDVLAWKLPLLVLVAGWVVLTIRSYFCEAREALHEVRRRLELKRRTELEKELGFEPLNLSDLSDDEINHMYAQWKGTNER